MIESEESSNQNLLPRVSKFLHLHSAFRKIWSYWTPRWYLEEAKKIAQPEDQELRTPRWYLEEAKKIAQPKDQELRTPLLSWRWSGCLSGHNLIRYCLKGRHSGIPIVKAMDWVIDRVGLRDFWDEMSCLSREPLRKNLWILIFQQLKAKQLQSGLLDRVNFLKKKSDLVQLGENLKSYIADPYGESLVLWHVATELLYNDFFSGKNGQDLPISFSENNNQDLVISFSENKDPDPRAYAKMSKTLSDYMMYLLIMQPDIMAPVAGQGKTTFQHICATAKKLFDGKDFGPSPQVRACNEILAVEPASSVESSRTTRLAGELHKLEPEGDNFSSLTRAINLAKELRKLEDKKKWEFIGQFWVESLCYAASHCSLKAHAQQLTKGGELITFVWLLMEHFSRWYSFDGKRLTTF